MGPNPGTVGRERTARTPRGMTAGAERDGPNDDLGLGTERWLSVREAARRASVDPRTIRRWADIGQIRARRTPGGHRQISLSGLADAYGARSKGTPSPVSVDPPTAVPQWTAQAALWHLWTPPRRMSDDELTELRLDVEACDRALQDLRAVIAEELRRRDEHASSPDVWQHR